MDDSQSGLLTEDRPVPNLRGARFAVTGIFLLVGLMLGSWYAWIPQVEADLGATHAEFGAVLLAQAAGLVVAMQLAGHVTARFGSASVARLTAVVLPWFLPAVTLAPSVPTAFTAMLLYGLFAGV